MKEKDLEGKRVYWTSRWDKLWLLIIPFTVILTRIINFNEYHTVWNMVVLTICAVFSCYIIYHMMSSKNVWIDPASRDGIKLRKRAAELTMTDEGLFTYDQDGFNITANGTVTEYAWADLLSVVGFNKRSYPFNRIHLSIFFTSSGWLQLNEDIGGWFIFNEKLLSNVEIPDREFMGRLMFPDDNETPTLVFDRETRSLEIVLKQTWSLPSPGHSD